MKSYFAYVRVSTVKQGEHGSSLTEQRSAIDAYAVRHNLQIGQWFEEMETAAKQGRREFARLIAELLRGRTAGVIIHKIDRGARNLKDWSQINDLMDAGIEVHFAHESLDMGTRGGRLAADIQAVVAADYVRNLRDEVRKGIYGRLKQGYYPLPAPRGYLNRGKAKAKEIDPVIGPLILQAFELYGAGTYGLETLRAEMAARGLRGKSGKPLSLDAMSHVLHNPFYIGMMRINVTGETFLGNHAPIVAKKLFDRVQDILAGRLYPRVQKNRFLFRRLIRCARCGRSLSGERQKGHVYYRCHDVGCRGVSVSERAVDEFVRAELALLRVERGELGDFREILQEQIACEEQGSKERSRNLQRDLGLLDDRLTRLTDALLDQSIDKATFDERKAGLIGQRLALREQLEQPSTLTEWQMIAQKFERGLVALLSYVSGNDDEKRETVKIVGSNLVVSKKRLAFPMYSPFDALRKWTNLQYGAPRHGAHRTSLLVKRRAMMRKFIEDEIAILAKDGSKTHTGHHARTTESRRASVSDRRPSLSRPNARGPRGSGRPASGARSVGYQDRKASARKRGAV